MRYPSKKPFLIPSIVIDWEDAVYDIDALRDFPIPVYRLKRWRRVLEADYISAFERWAEVNWLPHGHPVNTDGDECVEYWTNPRKWAVAVLSGREPATSDDIARAHHALGVERWEYKNGRLLRRQRALKPITDDYSLRGAAIALGKIREEDIGEAVRRGELLSSMAPPRRHRVSRPDLEGWVRSCWGQE
jgi:hypothetical protein